MTPEEYFRGRKTLGWTQAQYARWAGVDTMTVSRRERGELPIDGEAAHTMQRALELYARGELPEPVVA